MKGLQRDYHDSSDISRAYGNSATFPDLPRFTEAHAVPDDRSVILLLVLQLKLTSIPELLPLQTIQQYHTKL